MQQLINNDMAGLSPSNYDSNKMNNLLIPAGQSNVGIGGKVYQTAGGEVATFRDENTSLNAQP